MAKRNEPIVECDTVSTGIYVKRTVEPKTIDATDPVAMQSLVESASPRCSLESWLAEWQSYFAGIVQPYATESAGGYALDLGEGWKWYSVDASKAEHYIRSQVDDAIEGFNLVRQLAAHIEGDELGGRLPHAIQLAYELGRLVEKLQVRVCEPLALSGRKAHTGGKAGAAVTNADHAELHAKYQSAVDSLMRDEGISYTAATERVAAQFVVGQKTIQRNTINPAPRNQGRHKVGQRPPLS